MVSREKSLFFWIVAGVACSMKPILVAGVIVALAGVLAFVLTPPDPITFGLAWGAMALVSLVGYRLYWRMGRD